MWGTAENPGGRRLRRRAGGPPQRTALPHFKLLEYAMDFAGAHPDREEIVHTRTKLTATMNDIRVLLVDGELSDARFVEDALAEMEERTHGGAWIHCRVSHLERAGDAAILLEAERPDVVLFNPTLPDSRGLETYSTLRDAAPGVPLIALLEAGEEGLGRRMLRQGAQDFILKSEIDCQPLARAMLNAIERQRFYRATQLASAVDLETGFYHPGSFQNLANRDIQLARGCGRPLELVAAEIDSLLDVDAAYGREAAHDLIVEAANVIRGAAGETALIARTGLGCFAIATWQMSAERLIAAVQNQVQAGQHAFAFTFGSATMDEDADGTIDGLLRTAQAALDENKQAYLNLT
jgi:PleD family two-component response regulator